MSDVVAGDFPPPCRRHDVFPMKIVFCLLILALAGSPVSTLRAAASPDATVISAVTAADDERIAASSAADAARLDAILSDDLRYAHSNGKIDSKASLTDSLVSHKTVYEHFDYKERTITPVGPGAALMSGRVLVDVRSGGQKQTIDLNYLAVWREEQGKWRFLAWQSCRNPAPAEKKP